MKVQLLKNLIKEAVREVLKDELPLILQENKLSSPNLSSPGIYSQDYSNTLGGKNNGADTPLLSLEDILNETRQSMTRSDYSNIIGESTSFTPPTSTDTYNEVPSIGLDISKLDFVKKAASVYNLSNQKDKR